MRATVIQFKGLWDCPEMRKALVERLIRADKETRYARIEKGPISRALSRLLALVRGLH